MDAIPIPLLFGLLAGLLVLSGFFSGSETALMTLNRYRLRHLSDTGHAGARLASALLAQPDRLIGLILLGNNFVNILASSVATVIALRLGGEGALAISTGLLTLVVLIFAEVTPKTLAALNPERIAFPAAWVYTPLIRILHPFVWLVNQISNRLLRLLGAWPDTAGSDALSSEELRTIVNEAGAMIPKKHQKMLLNILDLEKATVEDIMIPRSEIDAIDISCPIDEILDALRRTPYTQVVAYRENFEQILGFLHARRLMQALLQGPLDDAMLDELMRAPYFVPEGTALNRQLMNFQRERRRIALVVDEYGDVRGLVTLGDLLEEIVGEFTTDPSDEIASVQPQPDGSYLVDGSANLRELNRSLHWQLPTAGPKTFNGLVLEHLESMPEPGISLLIAGYPVEILQTHENRVRTARIKPEERRPTTADAP